MWSFKRNIYRVSNPIKTVNCPIQAIDDYSNYVLNQPVQIDVIGNDGVIDYPVISIITPPLHGTASILLIGTAPDVYPYIVYTGTDGAFFSDSLVYEVTGRTCTDLPYSTAMVYLNRPNNPTPPAFYKIYLSNSSPLSNCDCSPNPCITSFPIGLYVANWPIALNTAIYWDSALTNPFDLGDGVSYFCISATLCYKIDASGVVISISNCTPTIDE